MKAILDIILVNRNSGSMLRDCIRTIASASRSRYSLDRVVVVDDCSTDNSLDDLERWKLPVLLIENDRRLGYGASCNIGAASSRADFLLFLNTDTRLVTDSIDVPISFIADPKNHEFKMVGIKLLGDSDTVSRSCSRFPTLGLLLNSILGLDRLWPQIFHGPAMREWHHLESRPVDQVIGAFLFVSRELFVQLKGYDERFFVYYEDLDLSLRARTLGFRNMYLSNAYAYHFEGGTSRKVWSESLFLNRHSRIKFAKKHFTPIAALVVAFATLLLEPVVRTLYALSQRSGVEMKANWVATWDLWRALLSRGTR